MVAVGRLGELEAPFRIEFPAVDVWATPEVSERHDVPCQLAR
jgi:hypothetical protein